MTLNGRVISSGVVTVVTLGILLLITIFSYIIFEFDFNFDEGRDFKEETIFVYQIEKSNGKTLFQPVRYLGKIN